MALSRKYSLRTLTALAAGLAFAAGAPAHAAEGDEAAAAGQGHEPDFGLLETYCTECHNFEDWAGGIAFDIMSPDMIGEEAEVWEEALRKLHGRLMPPPGENQPGAEELDAFVEALEARLDREAAERGPQPGYVTLHRLNRTEYANEIEALFDMEIDVEELLPPDPESDGFDNVANVLQVSPSFLDQYIGAAREVSIQAVGNGELYIDQASYLAPRVTNNNVHKQGLPLGTRGGMLIEHYFPADGEYSINIGMSSRGGELLRAYPTGWLEWEHTAVLLVDGEQVFEASLGGPTDMRAVDQVQQPAVTRILDRFNDIRVDLDSGTHTIAVAFIARTAAENDDLLENNHQGLGQDDVPIIRSVDIVGPYEAEGVGSTASREKIFSCYPESEAEQRPCAEEILTRMATQAYRRPVTHGELQNLMNFYESGLADGFDTGVQKALMAMLSSTNFLYRAEEAPEDAAEGEAFALTGEALANRLAFFLWSQGPDAELRQLAQDGELSDPQTLNAQVDRMLADPRSRSLVTNFAFKWLGGEKIEQIDPDPRTFPNFDADLREAFHTELELFLDSILRADVSVMELLTADHTFLNDRLAIHYDVEDVQGSNFRRVSLEDADRWGLLGKGAILMSTSYPNRTSPVLRGAWIMETLIGSPPSAPPPGVETDLGSGAEGLTLRARLEQHRADPTCNSCHGVIDPLGLALENYDAIGKWRDVDRFAGRPIDAVGRLAGSGRPVEGPADLREALAAEPERFATALTESLMTYALGRRVEYFDMPTVRAIVDQAAEEDYRFSAIVRGIVESAPFRMKAIPASDAEEADAGRVDEAALRP